MSERKDLFIDQGASVFIEINVTQEDGSPLDLSNYSKRSQMRRHFSSNTAYVFTTNTGDDLAGQILLTMTPNQSSEIPPGRYQYDVEIESQDGEVYRICEGVITVLPEVTRGD